MLTLKLIDRAFAHCDFSNNPLPQVSFSAHVRWDRNVNEQADTVFYTDKMLRRASRKHRKRIAWLIEPYVKQPSIYEWISVNNHAFDYVLTFEKFLLDRGDNFVFYPFGGCWVHPSNRRIQVKTKQVSIIASSKRKVPDHFKRHAIIAEHRERLDVFGSGYNPIAHIEQGLADYRFSIVMENQRRDFYFSEKLINAFVLGTVPIYHGCDGIGKFFDERGMICFREVHEIGAILDDLSEQRYRSMLPYVRDNFKAAKQYVLAEDWMYVNVFPAMGIIDQGTFGRTKNADSSVDPSIIERRPSQESSVLCNPRAIPDPPRAPESLAETEATPPAT